MPLTSTAALEMVVGVNGVGAAVGQLRTLAGGVAGVDSAVKRSFGSLVGLPRGITGAFRSVGSGLASSFGGLRGLLAPMGMALGGAGLVSMVREAGVFNSKLTSWRYELGESAAWAEKMRDRLGEAAVNTGRNRGELLAAAMAMQDLGMGADEAVAGLEDASAFAKLLDVSLEQAGPALAAMAKVAPNMGREQRMAVLREGANASGMPEETFLSLVSKLGPQIASLPGMKGQEGVAFLMRNIAARGQEFAEEPKRFKSAIRGFIDALGSQDAKARKAFAALNVNTGDLNQAEARLIDAAMLGERAFNDLPQPLRDYINETIRSDGAVQRLNETYRATSGDLTKATNDLTAGLDEMKKQTAGASLWEAIKQPFNSLGDDLVAWGTEHRKELVAAVQAVIGALQEMGAGIKTAFDWFAENVAPGFADFLYHGVTRSEEGNPSPIIGAIGQARERLANQSPEQRRAGSAEERMATAGSPAELVRAVQEYRAAMAASRAVPPIVQVFVDPRVAADATVRTGENATPTMVGPGGA